MNVLVTGGASGLGAAITREIAKDSSFNVYFTFNRSDEKAAEIMRQFPNAHGIKCDFAKIEQIEHLLASVGEMNLDGLVNNAYAGTFRNKHFHKTLMDEVESSFLESTLPTLRISQTVLLSLQKKRKGKVITVLTSALNEDPPTGSSVYLANKAYLKEMIRHWASENAKYNIQCLSISPSFMLTGMTEPMDERLVQQIKDAHPLRELLSPVDVARTIVFMLQAPKHINGLDFRFS